MDYRNHELILELNRYHKAEVIGPGVWLTLHIYSYLIGKSPKAKLADLFRLIVFIRKYFPCVECRGHFNTMCDQFLNFDNITEQNIFLKIYHCHKRVNDRLGKITPPYSLVEEQYEHIAQTYYSNPNSFFRDIRDNGPGMWWLLHATAEKDPYLTNLLWSLYQHHYPSQYIRDEMEGYSSMMTGNLTHDIWNVHSVVNQKLGKPNISEKMVGRFFRSDSGCQQGCTSTVYGKYIPLP